MIELARRPARGEIEDRRTLHVSDRVTVINRLCAGTTRTRPTSGIIDQAELDAVLLNWNASEDDGAASVASTTPSQQREPTRETPQPRAAERTTLESDSPRERSLRPARRADYDSPEIPQDIVHAASSPD